MAQMVGSSRARVNQVLKVWEARGLVAHRYGRVVLRDVEALAKMSEE
jgi:hypothetical protein